MWFLTLDACKPIVGNACIYTYKIKHPQNKIGTFNSIIGAHLGFSVSVTKNDFGALLLETQSVALYDLLVFFIFCCLSNVTCLTAS